jgi:signal transduction histidine kinase
MFSVRRLLHSVAYFLASVAVMGLFFVVLMLTESAWYTITGHAVSLGALVLAALSAALFFSPIVHAVQRLIDHIFFRRHLDTMAAIRELGAGDLAELPQENIEPALLQRIATISYRSPVALDERIGDEGHAFVFPVEAPTPPANGGNSQDYELVLPIPRREGPAWLHLGPRSDGWLADAREMQSLGSIARFASMSLEHARLSHRQVEAARLDSISRITAQLNSHDLKNRLHDLSFLAHHIGSGKLDEADIRHLLEAIRKVVGRMQTLMQRMADPQAPLHPSIAPCDLTDLLRRHCRERLWPEGIRVHVDLPELPPVAGDGSMLESVFENLFDNAVQAMQKQGDLSLTAELLDDCLEVRVDDTGIGMTRAFIDHRLFELFSTSKESGLGIGLYLSRRIIDAHQGTIRAHSPGKGKGCTFFVRLPLWQPPASEGSDALPERSE